MFENIMENGAFAHILLFRVNAAFPIIFSKVFKT